MTHKFENGGRTQRPARITTSFSPVSPVEFENLPKIRKAASAWPSPHYERGSEEFRRAGAILLVLNDFLADKNINIHRRMQPNDLSRLKRLKSDLSRALTTGANDEIFKQLTTEIQACLDSARRI